MAKRDLNILKTANRELNLSTRCTAPNKRQYKRKQKHKKDIHAI